MPTDCMTECRVQLGTHLTGVSLECEVVQALQVCKGCPIHSLHLKVGLWCLIPPGDLNGWWHLLPRRLLVLLLGCIRCTCSSTVSSSTTTTSCSTTCSTLLLLWLLYAKLQDGGGGDGGTLDRVSVSISLEICRDSSNKDRDVKKPTRPFVRLLPTPLHACRLRI